MRPAALLVLCVACGGLEPHGPISADSASGALHVMLTTTPDPCQRGMNSAEIALADALGEPRAGLDLTVTPWMPSHGHGSGVVPEVRELASGRYAVSNLYFAMPGEWQLRIGAANEEVVPSLRVP